MVKYSCRSTANIAIDFDTWLNIKLVEADMTKRELAERCGIAPPTIWRYCEGRRMPPLDIMVAMAHALGTNLASLDEYIRYED